MSDSLLAPLNAIHEESKRHSYKLEQIKLAIQQATAIAGPAGDTPYIGGNGNWWIDTTDTGVPATGPEGPLYNPYTLWGNDGNSNGNLFRGIEVAATRPQSGSSKPFMFEVFWSARFKTGANPFYHVFYRGGVVPQSGNDILFTTVLSSSNAVLSFMEGSVTSRVLVGCDTVEEIWNCAYSVRAVTPPDEDWTFTANSYYGPAYP